MKTKKKKNSTTKLLKTQRKCSPTIKWITKISCRQHSNPRAFLFLPVLLRYNWHAAFCEFKVYSIMIWSFQSWNDYHNKFSEYPSFHINIKLRIQKNLGWELKNYSSFLYITCLSVTYIYHIGRYIPST